MDDGLVRDESAEDALNVASHVCIDELIIDGKLMLRKEDKT